MPFSPFDPDRPEAKRRRFRLIPVRTLLPNLITLLALCAGLTAIRLAVEDKLEWAVAAIVFAALLDGIDGRVARMLKGTSRFGAELDSLADFVNFGVAPAFLIFNWGLGSLKSLGWIVVMIFALASALRLARFNVAAEEEHPRWQKAYFIGMPTPAAAIVVLLPVFIEHLGFDGIRSSTFMLDVVLVYTLVIAFLMVSTIPTFSGKLLGERISREYVLPIFMLAVGFVALLLTYPFGTLTGASITYLASIPVSYRRFARMLEATEAQARPEPRPEAPAAEAARIVSLRSGEPQR